MKKITLEPNEVLEMNGAVLTSKVLEFISMVQHEQNSPLKEIREDISEAISLLIMSKDLPYCDIAETDQSIINLNMTRYHLNALSAPKA